MLKDVIIIGYSGHALVVCDVFKSAGKQIVGYCDQVEAKANPYSLPYFGEETSSNGLEKLRNNEWFISIGNNQIRKRIFEELIGIQHLKKPVNAIHQTACIGSIAKIGRAVMIGANVTVNSQTQIQDGVILNTASIIEHECQIGNFSHIGPGAVLAGDVKVGAQSFIGANSVVKQGVTIGANVIVGAGSVIIKDIPDNAIVVGNPGRIIKGL